MIAGMSRRIFPVCIAVGLLWSAVPAVAASADFLELVRLSPGPERPEALRRWTAEVATVRSVVEQGSLGEAVRAAGRLGGLASTPVADPAEWDAPPIASGLLGATTNLLSVVRSADDLVRRSIHDPSILRETFAISAGRLGAPTVDEQGFDAAGSRARAAHIDAKVRAALDPDGIQRAGQAVADAIDRTLPSLRAYASSLRPSTSRVVGCDVLDQVPVLCIGGTGANSYTQDASLLIDLGGDDVHRHSAGGAELEINGLGVAVTLDLDGNDRYENVPERSSLSMGAAAPGVGVLVDAAGNDAYSLILSQRGKNDAGLVRGLGESTAGVGVFADLGGSDDYLIANRCTCADFKGAYAFGDLTGTTQGLGHAAIGTAVFIDRVGADTYRLLSELPSFVDQGRLQIHGPSAEGVGVGVLGGGAIFADLGGEDTMSIEARAAGDPSGPLPPDHLDVRWGSLTFGFGYANAAGGAVALSGGGSTRMTALADWVAPRHHALTQVAAFGHGLLGGQAAIDDPGGDDTYQLLASGRSRREVRVDDSCGCGGAHADAADPAAGDDPGPHSAVSGLGFGYSTLGGVGLVTDHSGSDRYLLSAEDVSDAVATDERTSGVSEGGGAVAVARSGNAFAMGQGAASADGVALLSDLGGDDVYDMHAQSVARAAASSSDAGAPRSARARSFGSSVTGQAGTTLAEGYAELFDFGGRDTYSATSTSTADALPETEVISGAASAGVQAAAQYDAIAWFTDGGDGGTADSFTSSPPSQPVCLGRRGEGIWQGCDGEPDPGNIDGHGAFGSNL